MEQELLALHNRIAKVVGQLSLTITRRSLRRAYALYWTNELRQAADSLEKLVKERPSK